MSADEAAARRPASKVTKAPQRQALPLPPGRSGVQAGGSAAPAAPASTTGVNALTAPRPYSVPASAERHENSAASAASAIVGIIFLAPFYAIFALLASIPAAVMGCIEAPKKDNGDTGGGTFYYGFAETYRWIMSHVFPFVQWPMQKLADVVGNPRGVFFVDKETEPGTQIITVRIRLKGDAGDIAKLKELEGAAENHLAIPGYKVNIEFVDRDGDDVNDVTVDREAWSSAYEWNPYDDDDSVDVFDSYMMAHESMHILGLLDEYNLDRHFTNPDMGALQRFGVFFSRLFQNEPPADADRGIMRFSARKPLVRHYEEALG